MTIALPETFNVLLVGNNPIELSATLEKLNEIRGKKIITEIAFDVRGIAERLMRFQPNFILIDDNVGRSVLSETVSVLTSDKKTKDVPITVLKNSNYQESLAAMNIMDYLLKSNLSAQALYNTLRNSFRFRRTQEYLSRAYANRKRLLKNIIGR